MGMIRKLTDTDGDTILAEWDVADETSVEKAREAFDKLIGEVYPGTKTRVNQVAELDERNIGHKMTEFNPLAGEIISWKQIVGG